MPPKGSIDRDGTYTLFIYTMTEDDFAKYLSLDWDARAVVFDMWKANRNDSED